MVPILAALGTVAIGMLHAGPAEKPHAISAQQPVDNAQQMVWVWPSSVSRPNWVEAHLGEPAPGSFEFSRVKLATLFDRYGIVIYSEFPTSAGPVSLPITVPMLHIRADDTFEIVASGELSSGVYLALGPTRLELANQHSIMVDAHELVCIRAVEPMLVPSTDASVFHGMANVDDDPDPLWNGQAGITCQTGYYACCNCVANSGASCKCHKNQELVQCQSGGEGATSASITCTR